MNRKLVAVLACRNSGSRLYGKPMQNLDINNGITILGHIISMLKCISVIDEIILVISRDESSKSIVKFAKDNYIRYVLGDENDVLGRVVKGIAHTDATDVFRITTESPFTYFEKIGEAWGKHVKNNNDITIVDDRLPEGCHFEIIRSRLFKDAYFLNEKKYKTEFCTLYMKENIDKFNFCIIPVEHKLKRVYDLRLTVDYPEDLILCRFVYNRLKHYSPLIPLCKIVELLDQNDEVKDLVKGFVNSNTWWT